MEFQPNRSLPVHVAQEVEELFMTVAFEALSDHGALQDIERGEQRGRAMAHVVVGHGPTASALERQSRLSSIQSLNLRLLVHAENQSLVRRIQIKAHHIAEFFHKVLVAGEFEGANPMRLQAMAIPDPSDRHVANAQMSSQGARTPMGGINRGFLKRRIDNPLDGGGIQTSRRTLARWLMFQPGSSSFAKTFAPENHRGARGAWRRGD